MQAKQAETLAGWAEAIVLRLLRDYAARAVPNAFLELIVFGNNRAEVWEAQN